MSVLIKGMDMPKTCGGCDILDNVYYCYLVNDNTGFYSDERYANEKHPDCPLVEIPPHGRLIDADKLILDFIDWWYSQFLHEQNDISLTIQEAMKGIEEAPTIIEAEK